MMPLAAPLPDPPSDPDWQALEPLVREHQAAIWRYLRFLGSTPDEADELTQDAFLQVAGRALHRFAAGSARAYLRRVARNALLKRRRQQRQPLHVDLDEAELAYDWYCRGDDGGAVLAALRACLERLDDQARDGLTLRFADQLERPQIAARLGLSSHGVKSLLQRAYARLRACVERRLEHDR